MEKIRNLFVFSEKFVDMKNTDNAETKKQSLRLLFLEVEKEFNKPNIQLKSYSPEERLNVAHEMMMFEEQILSKINDKNARELVNDCRNTVFHRKLFMKDYLVCSTLSNLLEKIK